MIKFKMKYLIHRKILKQEILVFYNYLLQNICHKINVWHRLAKLAKLDESAFDYATWDFIDECWFILM